MSAIEVVVIGASLGGLEALQLLLSGLSPGFPAAVVIVQHRLTDLVQDSETAFSPISPRAAIERGAVDEIVALERMARTIAAHCRHKTATGTTINPD